MSIYINHVKPSRVGKESIKVTTATVRLPQNVQGQNRDKASRTRITPGPNMETPTEDSSTHYKGGKP
jgi:hypothetical protein